MAQFKYTDADKIKQERKSAIESLIPGTKAFYHLYFLDVVKHQNPFTSEQEELYGKFKEEYGSTPQFHEIETWLNLINKLQKLTPISE